MWLDTSTAFPCAAKVRNRLVQLLAADRVHAVERLVEHEQIGVVHQRLAKLDALPHTLRVGTHRPIGALGHADRLEHRLGTPPRLGPGEPSQPGRHAHQLPPRQLIPRRVAEWAQPDVIFRPGRPGVPAAHVDPAQAWLDLACEQPQQRRFARAVWPDQAGDAGADLEAHAVERHHRAEPLGHISHLGQRSRHSGFGVHDWCRNWRMRNTIAINERRQTATITAAASDNCATSRERTAASPKQRLPTA